jgi:hypothetical protein
VHVLHCGARRQVPQCRFGDLKVKRWLPDRAIMRLGCSTGPGWEMLNRAGGAGRAGPGWQRRVGGWGERQ